MFHPEAQWFIPLCVHILKTVARMFKEKLLLTQVGETRLIHSESLWIREEIGATVSTTHAC